MFIKQTYNHPRDIYIYEVQSDEFEGPNNRFEFAVHTNMGAVRQEGNLRDIFREMILGGKTYYEHGGVTMTRAWNSLDVTEPGSILAYNHASNTPPPQVRVGIRRSRYSAPSQKYVYQLTDGRVIRIPELEIKVRQNYGRDYISNYVLARANHLSTPPPNRTDVEKLTTHYQNYGGRTSSLGKEAEVAFQSYYSQKKRQLSRTEENISMLKEFKQYLSEYRNPIFTVLLLLLADYFFLGGALRGRLQRLLEAVTNKAEAKLNADLDGNGVVGDGTDTDE